MTETTNVYFHNNDWQILSEYDGSNNYKKSYVYGNYIDEVLMSFVLPINSSCKYYVHDHLYSPAALLYYSGPAVDRYEYDAYGNCTILSPTYDIRNTSLYDNPYLFTGRRLDILDNGSLKLAYHRNRYYDQYTGRFFTHDPMGYVDGINLYEYGGSNPVSRIDPFGDLSQSKCQTTIGVILTALRAVNLRCNAFCWACLGR
jgi:RHS repeat-associated protein